MRGQRFWSGSLAEFFKEHAYVGIDDALSIPRANNSLPTLFV